MTTFDFMQDLEAMALYSSTECVMTRMPVGCGWLIRFRNKDNELTDPVMVDPDKAEMKTCGIRSYEEVLAKCAEALTEKFDIEWDEHWYGNYVPYFKKENDITELGLDEMYIIMEMINKCNENSQTECYVTINDIKKISELNITNSSEEIKINNNLQLEKNKEINEEIENNKILKNNCVKSKDILEKIDNTIIY